MNRAPSFPLLAGVLGLPLTQLVLQPPDVSSSSSQKSKVGTAAVALLKQIEFLNHQSPEQDHLSQKELHRVMENLSSACKLLCDAVLIAKVLYNYDQIQSEERCHYIKALQRTDSEDEHSNLFLLLVASAVVMSSEEFGTVSAATELILNTVSCRKELGTGVLPLMLYKLGRSRCPQTLQMLLQSFPKMAVHKVKHPTFFGDLGDVLQTLARNGVNVKITCFR